MRWIVVAAIAALWLQRPEPRCEDTSVHVARQRLSGASTGPATADLSTDGRVVAFISLAQLTPDDVNTVDDVYVFDRTTSRFALESVAPGGAADGSSQQPRVSGDGRVLVFATVASNIVGAGVVAVGAQVVRRDRATRSTTLVSHTPGGGPGNGWSGHADISDDGRFVVFESRATNLVPGHDANAGGSDVYLFDAHDGSLRRVSQTDAGEQSATGQSSTPALSGTGRFVAFSSTAPLDGPARARTEAPIRDVFRRDLTTGALTRISATQSGGVPNGPSYHPAISGDGRQVVFVSTATNLQGAVGSARPEQLYFYEADTGRLRLLSRSAAGRAGDGDSRFPAISGDGRYVVFSSAASNLRCAAGCQDGRAETSDVNLVSDVYRVDTLTGAVDRISGDSEGPWWRVSTGAAVDGTGHVVAFSSRQPIDDADLEDDDDLFVKPARNGCPSTDRP